MLCRKPVYVERLGHSVPCGHCRSCRATLAATWAGRLRDESDSYAERPLFVMLSQNDQSLLPEGLSKPRMQRFIKRLRFALSGRRKSDIKYYLCGEYGPKTGRPHYHLILFGVPLAQRDTILKAWGHCDDKDGHYYCEYVSQDDPERGYGYVAGYIRKKLAKGYNADFRRLHPGKTPEFSMQSSGIGKRYALKMYLNQDKLYRRGRSWRLPCRYYRKVLGIKLEQITGYINKRKAETLNTLREYVISLCIPPTDCILPRARSIDDLTPLGFKYMYLLRDLVDRALAKSWDSSQLALSRIA